MALSEFGKAFANARKAGKLTFDFNGKKYTTERADDKPGSRSPKYATSADTAAYRADRDRPRSGGANISTPLRKTKPAPLSKETEDEVYRMFGKPSPSEIQDMKNLREELTGSSAERLIRKQAEDEPAIDSLSYDDFKITPRVGRGRGAFAAGGRVKKYSGEEGSEVKKDKPYLGPREQADVRKMEKMQRESKTPIGDIEPVPGHYGDKKYAKGGKVEKESKGMMKKEIAFFKKKKAPKSMIKHEEKEAKGMKRGGMACMARGGGIESRGKTQGTSIKAYKKGGVVDGIAQRGKTKGKVC